ncbi:tetratricopeptide repeat protein [Persicimonas caeni]|uniref:Tetratricopeptide repeat protein n=1 Tax=Persicimonas caeni TaxID=2292766 RepID=A0A4Y6PNP0_PERCE|nr:tetratricopeptide repeat protein [Persicimonas caeni]QDG49938.1 tetratricopeptide repeat protein [Persicimonas caeni]QED31159.1 tetratricopeptide repeat protein [Persicimonas caeni]
MALTILVMSPALGGEWLGDDPFLITETACNRGLEAIPSIVKQQAQRCNYRPLRHISYAIDYAVWGLRPFGYHLSNLLLHLGAVAATYLIYLRLGLVPLFAAIGAAVVAIHPVQVDAVGYISGRRDVLMGFCYLIAVIGTIEASRRRHDSGAQATPGGWAALAAVGAIGSVTSKEMGVTIVAIMALFLAFGGHAAFRRDAKLAEPIWQRIRQFRWLLALLAIPAGAMIVWRGLLRPVSTVADSWFGGSLVSHAATVLAVHARYLELVVFPWRLAGDYAPPVIEVAESLLDPAALMGALWISALITAMVFAYRKDWLKMSYGLAWYLVTMLPVSHIIPHHELAAEHYLYIPLVGLALSVAALGQRAWNARDVEHPRLLRRTVVLVVLVGLSLLGTRTFLRAFDYRSEIAHATQTVRHFPTSVRGRARLGIALLNDDQFDAARPHLEYVLGTSFQGSARLDVLRELGRAFVMRGEHAKAQRLLNEYLTVRPDDLEALANLSKVYFETGELAQAHRLNQRLVEVAPTSAEHRYKLALTSWMLGDKLTARAHASRALQVEPDHIDALLLAANLWVTEDPRKAGQLLRRAQDALRQSPEPNHVQRNQLLRKLRERLDYAQHERSD